MAHYVISTEGEYVPLQNNYNQFVFSSVRRCVDKNKGLRHFSLKVCELVKERGRTTYNDVADELVNEHFYSLESNEHGFQIGSIYDPVSMEKRHYEMKNIRRRVYDALNVLIAMNVIERDKSNKDICWIGMPTSNAQDLKRLRDDKEKREERVKEKNRIYDELKAQLNAYKSVVERNREEERATTSCQATEDKTELNFSFNQPFEINDDIEVLHHLELAAKLEKEENKAQPDVPPTPPNIGSKTSDKEIKTELKSELNC